jgi:hypothetical protein
MPTPTYKPLATMTLTATATSVTFSSISQAYRDLILVCDGLKIASAGTCQVAVQVNNITTSTYTQVHMGGNGSATNSTANTLTWIAPTNPDAIDSTGNPANFKIDFLDYSVTDKHKSGVYRYNKTNTYVIAGAFRVPITAAITTIKVFPTADTFAIGGSFTLYGIVA